MLAVLFSFFGHSDRREARVAPQVMPLALFRLAARISLFPSSLFFLSSFFSSPGWFGLASRSSISISVDVFLWLPSGELHLSIADGRT